MNTFSKLTATFVAIVVAAVLATGPNESTTPAWMRAVEGIGPGTWVFTEDKPCYYYTEHDQLVCYRVFETWFGIDAQPVTLNHEPL